MKGPVIPKTYEQWQHCIVVECGLELSPQYITQRLSTLKNDREQSTKQFIKLYGKEYHEQVVAWFAQAQQNLNSAAQSTLT